MASVRYLSLNRGRTGVSSRSEFDGGRLGNYSRTDRLVHPRNEILTSDLAIAPLPTVNNSDIRKLPIWIREYKYSWYCA
jgi:hypothetical protein